MAITVYYGGRKDLSVRVHIFTKTAFFMLKLSEVHDMESLLVWRLCRFLRLFSIELWSWTSYEQIKW